MSTSFAPVSTFNAAGNADASASLAASANRSFTIDISGKFAGLLHIKNTPGGSVAATRGVKVEVFRRYGSTPTTGETAFLTVTLPSTTASTAESTDFSLPTGKYSVKMTNLDATNAVTLEATLDTIDTITG